MSGPFVAGHAQRAEAGGSPPRPLFSHQISATLVISAVFPPANLSAASSATLVMPAVATLVIIDVATLVIIDVATLVIIAEATLVIIPVSSPQTIVLYDTSPAAARSTAADIFIPPHQVARFQRENANNLKAILANAFSLGLQ
jgi:hypothetical protein